MNSSDRIPHDLVFGPFKTEWFQRSITDNLRQATLRFIEQQVIPQLEGEITGLKGTVTSHYDHPKFSGRPDLAHNYFLNLRFDSTAGVQGATGEILFDPKTGECRGSRVKPVRIELLEGPRRPFKPINKPKRPGQPVTFPVSDVIPCFESLPEIQLAESLPRVTRTKLLVCPDPARPVVPGISFHPLIAGAAMAYQKHYPLVLSPDMIWLTVLQGVSQHIQNHAESLRSRVVRHQTKIELMVDLGFAGLPQDPAQMQAAAEAFCAQIWRHVEPEIRPLLEARFSTTSSVEEIAAAVVIMEAFQPYFDYIFGIICGIPSVLLEGTVADWELLESKVEALNLSDLELSWWTAQLRPLCRQFVRAVGSDVDTGHWKNLCKVEELYGVDDLNGWLLKFIPYVRDEKNERLIHRNPVLGLSPERPPRLVQGHAITGCTSDMLPTGLSTVPVTLMNAQAGRLTPIRFLAGFTGVEQAYEDLGLRPVIGWAIAEPPAMDILLQRLRTYPGSQPREAGRGGSLLENLQIALTADMWRYYSEFESVTFEFPKCNRWQQKWCRTLSVGEIKPLWDSDSVLEELNFLLEQNLITKEVFDERRAFINNYGSLLRIATFDGSENGSSYVYGRVGPEWQSPPHEVAVYHWTGKRNPEAFTAVADSFTEWLKDLIETSDPAVAPDP